MANLVRGRGRLRLDRRVSCEAPRGLRDGEWERRHTGEAGRGGWGAGDFLRRGVKVGL